MMAFLVKNNGVVNTTQYGSNKLLEYVGNPLLTC